MYIWGFPGGSAVKKKNKTTYLPRQEMWIQSLGQEYSLEKRNGNPLQYSCLENLMDKGGGYSPWGCQE